MSLNEQLRHKIDFKTKPIGSLGRLEEIALQVGLIQNSLTPELRNPSMLVFAADHGLTAEGISPFPKEVTYQMVYNFLQGGAAINVFCRQHGIAMYVVDAGVDHTFPDHPLLIKAKIGYGTRNSAIEPAMTAEECQNALHKGVEIVEQLAANGCNCVGFGEMGIGNTSSAALLMHLYTKIQLEECIGRGTGVDEAGLLHKKEVLARVSTRHQRVSSPLEILAAVGGLEIAMMTGAMLAAARKDMVLLIDGFIATSAILAASKIEPFVLDKCIFTHQSDERGHSAMLDYLGAQPLLRLGMRLGEGTGAAVAFPLIKSAVCFLNEMASFDDAGVTNTQ